MKGSLLRVLRWPARELENNARKLEEPARGEPQGGEGLDLTSLIKLQK